MPQLEAEVYQNWSDDGDVVAFAISSSTIGPENPEDLAQYVEGMGLTMTVLADWKATIYDEWRIADSDQFAPYPREYVIGRDGRLVYVDATLDVQAMNAAIQAALSQ